jgi:hypothetical protein
MNHHADLTFTENKSKVISEIIVLFITCFLLQDLASVTNEAAAYQRVCQPAAA